MEGDQAARNVVVRCDLGLCHSQQRVDTDTDIDTDIDRFVIKLLILLCAQNLLTAHRHNHTFLQQHHSREQLPDSAFGH